MAATAYGQATKNVNIPALGSATVKALLVTSSYTFDQDAHDFLNDVTGEVTGTGYTAGGVTLTTVALSYDSTNNRVKIDADDAAFGTVTLTGVTGMIVYVSTGTSSTSPLLSYHSFSSQSPSGVTFTYQFHANGIVTLTA